MKIAIIGSRNLVNINIDEEVDKLCPTAIISGGAKGIDTLAEDYAKRHNLPITIYKPEYDKYPGKIAPLRRNEKIVDSADFVLAFWDGQSHGTKFTLQRAQRLGKPNKCILIEKPKDEGTQLELF